MGTGFRIGRFALDDFHVNAPLAVLIGDERLPLFGGQLGIAGDHYVVDLFVGIRLPRDHAQAVGVDIILADAGQGPLEFFGHFGPFPPVLGFQDGGVQRGPLGHRRIGREIPVRFDLQFLFETPTNDWHQRRTAHQDNGVQIA